MSLQAFEPSAFQNDAFQTVRVIFLDAEAGTYTVTGIDADFFRNLRLDGQSGSYVLAGEEAQLFKQLIFHADAGNYAYTGRDAGLYPFALVYDINGQTKVLLFASERYTELFCSTTMTDLEAGESYTDLES